MSHASVSGTWRALAPMTTTLSMMLGFDRQIAVVPGEVLLFLGLVIKEPYNKICFPLLCALLVYSTFYLPSRASLNDYYMTVALFVQVCDGLDYLVIRDAQNKLRYKDQSRPASEYPLFQRAKWALRLLTSPRAIGWKHEPANSAPPHVQIKSRSYFISRTLLDIACYGITFTIVTLQIPRNPALVKGGPRLTELRWTWRLHGIFTWLILQYAAMQFKRTWHQSFRRFYFSLAIAIGHNILRLRLGSIAFGLVIVVVSFVTTGVMHSLGDYVLSGHYGGSMKFFCVQGFGCVVEVYTIEIIRNWGSKTLPDHFTATNNNKITTQSSPSAKPTANQSVKFRPPRRASQVPLFLRLIGYVYTIYWLYYTMPILLDPVLKAGILEDGVMNIWTGWTNNEWVVYPQMREDVQKYLNK